ncbi:EAL domain-containing protein [Streptomyces sp. WAC05458]|uniref:putative bifunctional diguanylate cyclase/phosphodiesterase n=1 Tax=unclassified Streptomyces TaxID=2593676 RepID=UPI000FB08298|nr:MULTISPECIES: bifunctional diguanylate cyclase/phosphodiesterase [unclassified Streptomyces]RSS09681.1 EAL domain-containing protein [Streptomyces sp. WAC08401]RSS16222.1 EAL domain-containing protein [Streptomyces sp. WAC05458]
MEPTESAAAGSRLRLRRMAGAWHASRWFGRRDGGAPSPAADARGCAPPATARASAPPPTGRGGPPASHTGQDSAPPPTGQGAPRSSTGHVSAPSATGHTPSASTTGPVPTRPAGGRGPASRAPGRGPRGRIPGPGAAPSRPGTAPVGTDADGERHLPWPALPSAVVAAASFVLGAGFYRAFTGGHALFPSGTAGWALAVLTGIVVGHLVMLGRSRWWGGTGSGAALTLAVLLLYGWVPAGMVSLTVVVLVGIARRGRWRHGVLHGAVDILGIAAGATLLGVCGSVPSVEEPWDPATWGVYAAPKVVLVAVAYLAVTRALLWYLQTPRAGLPTVARTALVRQGLVAVALLGIAPLVCVVAVAKPLLLPLFAIPLIALDSTLWIARARAEEQLRDPLTGLPNRQWLLERTWTALDDAERIGARAALMLIDLDRFRSVNDTLGHLAGDRLLLQTADRLRQALPRGAEAARLGGDEFAVLLPVADSTTSATRIARGLVGALGSPMDLDGLTLVLEASAGVAVFPDHALDAEGLLRRADVAMYQAKRDRTGVEVYESKRDSNTPDRLGLLGDLRRALDAHEVQLHYQPKVRFDGQVAGLEALVRWVHPERGKVPPDEFIAIAESSGLMPHLTEYVLETALEQVAHWRSQGLFVPVAVNVSPRDVHTPGFAGSVAARLARHGVPAGALQLEITEHVLLEDPQRAADTLNALTGHGVKMSLDDFGTGYSSLVHLRRLPVSELKIDRSFVARLAVDTEDAEIVRCTVDLAHSLGLLVVAEGVEDDETWERLRDLGCDAVQGWLVAAAMPPEETTAWLLARGARGWQRPAAALPAAAADDQGRLG